jgi:hypothetical protein
LNAFNDIEELECLTTESEEQKRKIKMIINRLSKKIDISYSEARAIVHKYVCEGKCDWYQTESRNVGFDRQSLKGNQKKLIDEIVKETMKDLTMEEAKWQIHKILCPSHPRPSPKPNTG